MKKIAQKTIQIGISLLIFTYLTLSLMGCSTVPTPTAETPTSEPSDSPRSTSTGTKAAQSPTPTETPTAIEVDPAALEGIAIRFIHPWSGVAAETLADIGRKFSLSNPWGIWVDVAAQGSESLLLEEVQNEIAIGEIPALIAIEGYDLSLLEGNFGFVPLTDYFNDPNWGIDADSQVDIPQVYLDQYTVDEEIVALPVAPQAAVLFLNKTWAEELGYESVPTDEKSFEDLSCAATASYLQDQIEDNDYLGGYLMNYAPNVLLSWYTAFGGDILQDEILQFDNQAGQSAFEYLETLFSPDKNCIWEGRQPEPYQYFANRYAMVYAGTLDQIPLQSGWMAQMGNNDQWIATRIPGPEGDVMIVDSPGLFISEASPEEQLAAWLFARHLITPEVQARLVQSLFSLPVRKESLNYLNDFSSAYPQWASALNWVDTAQHAPISSGWGIGRWVLQDGIKRLFMVTEEPLDEILTQIDQMIEELVAAEP